MHLHPPLNTPPGDLGQQVLVDATVLSKLPPGTRILSASRHATTHHIETAKLVAQLPDNFIATYLLRASSSPHGKALMRGEFESHSAIHSALPGICPRPVAWGAFKARPNTYYNLRVHTEPTGAHAPADPLRLAAQLAKMHARSRSSEIGAFGFHAATHTGSGAVLTPRVQLDTWEAAFTALLRAALALEADVNGAFDGLDELVELLFAVVVPRLLRGLRIRPTLVHGDLTAANTAAVDGRPGVMVLLPAAVWAHHEYEFGGAGIGAVARAYRRLVPPSEPAQLAGERERLYALRFAVWKSVCFPGSIRYRHAVAEGVADCVRRWVRGPPRQALTAPAPAEEVVEAGEEEDGGQRKTGRRITSRLFSAGK
ncbi:Fructosamine kinase-domain-containing protein [Geopyxis carbonaria]|nr:Fructosamine kinase-domain-containing protein [Geopyxis carbonaria]